MGRISGETRKPHIHSAEASSPKRIITIESSEGGMIIQRTRMKQCVSEWRGGRVERREWARMREHNSWFCEKCRWQSWKNIPWKSLVVGVRRRTVVPLFETEAPLLLKYSEHNRWNMMKSTLLVEGFLTRKTKALQHTLFIWSYASLACWGRSEVANVIMTWKNETSCMVRYEQYIFETYNFLFKHLKLSLLLCFKT